MQAAVLDHRALTVLFHKIGEIETGDQPFRKSRERVWKQTWNMPSDAKPPLKEESYSSGIIPKRAKCFYRLIQVFFVYPSSQVIRIK